MATTSDGTPPPRESTRTPDRDLVQMPDASIAAENAKTSSDSNSSAQLQVGGIQRNDQEHAVGITAYVSPDVPGFNCIIKHRYTDFIVNEILPNGQVLHLTSLSAARKGQKQEKDGVVNGTTDVPGDGIPSPDSTETAQQTLPQKREAEEDDEPSPGDPSTPRKKRRIEQTETPGRGISVDEATAEASELQEMPASASNGDGKEQILANVSESAKSALQGIFGEKKAMEILNLYANVILHPDRKPRDQPTVMSDEISEKAKRTEAHVAIRGIFNSKLETMTMQDMPGVMSVKAAPNKGPSGARAPMNGSKGAYTKGKLGWNELGGEYLHFTLYKENKDTMEVLYYIASQLKIPIKNFQFAGTKDRRGVTAQRVAVFRVYADRISKLNRMARGWRAGDFEYKKHGLDLGELTGNEFLLTLRDCHFHDEEDLEHEERLTLAKEVTAKAVESFREKGFLNYYGLQRFGTFSTGTHTIGQYMLKGDLEAAIDCILTYSDDMLSKNQDTTSSKKVPQDDINRADAIRLWRTEGKVNDAVSKMPRRFQAESAIIQYLGRRDRKSGKLLQDRDWQGALMQIQRNLRLMYVHAYQSYVWNTVAGKRWELYGGPVVEGDLVIVGEKDEDAGNVKDQVDEDGEPIFHPAEDDSAPSAEDAFTRARQLTKQEAESGKYDIFDIVLPLPGFDVLYPANAVGEFYKEFMASEDGGAMDPHDMRRPWKDISLSGGYRKMMSRPGQQFEFEVRSYSAEEEQMVETDLEKIEKGRRAKNAAQAEKEDGMKDSEPVPPSTNDKIAVILKMQLGSSQYATMALRELTKGGAVNFKPDYSSR